MFYGVVICCVLAASCYRGGETDSTKSSGAKPGVLTVHVVNYPLAFFAERIGGTAVDVDFPVPRGVDPAHWNPDPETIARAQRADLFLRSGAGDPAWIDLASLHRDRVVDTTAYVRDRLLAEETVAHQHGPEGEHSHGTWSGTTWLDPLLAASQAQAVAEALAVRRPDQADSFRSNLAILVRELEQLDEAQAIVARKLGGTPLLYSHRVYLYLQARYALNGRTVDWEPDEMPNEVQWRALRRLLDEHPARSMLWKAEPMPEIAERLAALGIQSLVYPPCANRPDAGDWLSVMHANLRVLEMLSGASVERR